MNKFKFYFLVSFVTLSLFSCRKDDIGITVEPPRDYKVQYIADTTLIKDYLDKHYIIVKDNPGLVDDQDVTIVKREDGDTEHKSITEQTKYKLLSKDVFLHDIKYKLYYLVLRSGAGESPCNVDDVLAAYKGTYLRKSVATETTASVSATFFEESRYPQAFLNLFPVGNKGGLITGWSEILPQFKSGTNTINDNGTVSHKDFGAGVIFIPSGLAYYNRGIGLIPSYSPLVFSFKLYEIKRIDSDNDGLFNYQEGLNPDGYIYDYRNKLNYPTAPADEKIHYADDTDKDGIPDFLDVDDDGDNYTTRFEITKPAGTDSGLSLYFPYDPISDNPFTTVIETEDKGIPSFDATKPEKFDYTTIGRKRIHLDEKYPVKK
jgi:FKBP-type peptidyl-prolyl cis-trans isomerase